MYDISLNPALPTVASLSCSQALFKKKSKVLKEHKKLENKQTAGFFPPQRLADVMG